MSSISSAWWLWRVSTAYGRWREDLKSQVILGHINNGRPPCHLVSNTLAFWDGKFIYTGSKQKLEPLTHSQGGTCRFPVLARASLICLWLVGLWFEAHTSLTKLSKLITSLQNRDYKLYMGMLMPRPQKTVIVGCAVTQT